MTTNSYPSAAAAVVRSDRERGAHGYRQPSQTRLILGTSDHRTHAWADVHAGPWGLWVTTSCSSVSEGGREPALRSDQPSPLLFGKRLSRSGPQGGISHRDQGGSLPHLPRALKCEGPAPEPPVKVPVPGVPGRGLWLQKEHSEAATWSPGGAGGELVPADLPPVGVRAVPWLAQQAGLSLASEFCHCQAELQVQMLIEASP